MATVMAENGKFQTGKRRWKTVSAQKDKKRITTGL